MKEKYEKLFDNTNKKRYIHNSLVYIESGNGAFSFSKGYGGKDINTPFVAASITKMFTASCILVLIENKVISLNDKVSKFYDDSFIKGLHIYKGKDYSHELTIYDLLFQTSGLADVYNEGKNNLKRQMINKDAFLSFEEMISLTKRYQACFAPGNETKAHYADINYDILGDIIEKVTQMPLEQVFEQYIFEPLGMVNTYLPISESEGIPKLYYKDKELYRPQFVMSSRASGGCITTGKELMIFTKAFFGGKLFNKALFEHISKCRKLQLIMTPIQYGSGYMRIKLGGISSMFMGRGDLIGHSGSTGSFAFYLPDSDLFFVGDFNQIAYLTLTVKFVMQLAMLTSADSLS